MHEEQSTTEVPQAFIAKARSYLMTDYLPKIERCMEALSDEDVWWRSGAESNSIGNLILHLCGNARQWIVCGIGGETDTRQRQSEFDERSLIRREELLQHLRQTLQEVDGVLAELSHTSLMKRRTIQGTEQTILEAIFHVVEHFSMHTGQIILLTKMLTRSDLRFYDFSAGAPRPDWHRP
ncbi:MAG: DUF1572 domain-containing protein [Acidobacteria bacterium]|nr:DUF1572 domain-containing protein [Acidobacteriota bacterium]